MIKEPLTLRVARKNMERSYCLHALTLADQHVSIFLHRLSLYQNHGNNKKTHKNKNRYIEKMVLNKIKKQGNDVATTKSD